MTGRNYEFALAGSAIIQLLAALHARAAVSGQGERMRSISFIDAEPALHGLSFGGNIAAPSAWGFSSDASPARCEVARSDLQSFSSSVCLSTWRSGSWPARWLETNVDAPLARQPNRRLSIAFKLPFGLAAPVTLAFSSDDGGRPTRGRKNERNWSF